MLMQNKFPKKYTKTESDMFYLFDYFIHQPYLKDLTISIHEFWNS